MKKAIDEMRAEYDFSEGVRGKHVGANIRIVGARGINADERAEIDAELDALDSAIENLHRFVKNGSRLPDEAQASISYRLKEAAQKLSRIADQH
ncbi:MAG: hypothetical protein ABR577_11595 [Pyrinomonadaceae bacterium]